LAKGETLLQDNIHEPNRWFPGSATGRMNGKCLQPEEPLLRPLAQDDVSTIESWPDYPTEFQELNYALRKDGWLAEFGRRPDTWLYAAEQAGQVIAFTILATSAPDEAEFRIALRADKSGQGLGRVITNHTLTKAFGECGLSRVHLIVRKNNRRAIELYRRLGFTHRGECRKTIDNQLTDFLSMDLGPRQWLAISEG